MRFIIWLALAAIAGIGGWWYWRMRRKREPRMISFVALLSEPTMFDPAVLAKTAGRAWKADLGDGSVEGEDGFVVGAGPINTIVYDDQPYLINCLPNPYVEDLETFSESIVDLRIRQKFVDHKAWFSCDALGVDGATSAEEISDYYRRLAKLFAEFLDDHCLLIYLPDTNQAFAINDETERALHADDPIAALQETLTLPCIQVSPDDALMQEAEGKARENWTQFVTAFEVTAGEGFSVKAPVTHSHTTEYIWLTVTALEGDRIYGMLANEPVNLGSLKLGSKVSVALADLNDWCYLDSQGNPQGGFTIAAVQNAARRHQRRN